jgi:hypothetical protein
MNNTKKSALQSSPDSQPVKVLSVAVYSLKNEIHTVETVKKPITYIPVYNYNGSKIGKG